VRVTVTASNSAGSGTANSAPTGVVSAGASPTATSMPSISGTPTVGSTLNASPGTWTGASSYAYQWTRCNASGGSCGAIAGATASNYVPVSADVSSTLRVNVLASNTAGTSTATSPATSAVQGALGSVNGPWWTSTSPFNLPIPAGAAVDPNSQTWVNLLYNSSAVNSIWVNNTAWTTTVYHAKSGTPTVTVAVANTGKHIKIPYQSGWVASPDGDSHIAIIDDTTGCEYEFQQFSPSTLTGHAVAVFHVDTGTGSHDTAGAGVTGGQMSVIAGLITPQDVASGAIRHAMRLATPVNSSAYRLPATWSDGNLSGGIPEGALIRLDPTLDLSTLNLTPFQLMFAKALQTYGAYDDDNGGGLAVYAESTSDGSSYALPITGLPKSLVLKLQVMAPLYSSVPLDTNTTAGCYNPY
jgi:predicted actin-binding protein